MKNKIWIILGIATLLFLVWLLWVRQDDQQKVNWELTPIERGTLEMLVSASGTLSATNTVEVGTQVSGVIEDIYVDFNEQVAKGQVIAKLDIRNLEAALNQAEAAVAQARVQLGQKKRAYELAQQYNAGALADLSVLEAEASLQQVQAQLDQAKRNYLRYQTLYEQGVVAKVEYETRLTEYEQLKANVQSRSALLKRAKANVGNVDVQRSKEDFDIAAANLASITAARNQAKIKLDFAYIRAPIEGIVISRNIEVGQTVAASFQTPVLFTIAHDLTKMEIEASIDEADIGFIQNGQMVSFTVDSYLERSFSGIVEQIRLQPQIISNVVTYTVIINAANEDMKLMPGMTANLDITTAQRLNVLKAPIAALNFYPPSAYILPWKAYLEQEGMAIQTNSELEWGMGILWILEDDQPVPKKVKTGLSDGNFTEISSKDFRAGDLVITGLNSEVKASDGNQQASPFMPSRPGKTKNK